MKDQRIPPGPKNRFNPIHGPLVKINLRGPVPVRELLKEAEVKKLLDRMALEPDFKIQVLGMIEKP